MSDILNDTGAKVLYAALRRMTDDRTVIKQAFQHWVTELSSEPFDVIQTVASLEKFLGLSTQERKVLMIGMHAASNRGSHELKSVPDYILGDSVASQAVAAKNKPSSTVKAKQPYAELAEGYFAQIAQAVRRGNGGDYRELMSALKDEGLNDVSAAINKAVKASSSEENFDLPSAASETDCQDFCHSLYMLVAEIVGPIDADTFSNSAIAALLDIEAAVRYDPRKLL